MVYDEGMHPRVETRLDYPTPGPRQPLCTVVGQGVQYYFAHWQLGKPSRTVILKLRPGLLYVLQCNIDTFFMLLENCPMTNRPAMKPRESYIDIHILMLLANCPITNRPREYSSHITSIHPYIHIVNIVQVNGGPHQKVLFRLPIWGRVHM